MFVKTVSYLLVIVLVQQICEAIYIPPGPRYRCPEKVQSIYPCVCLKGSDKGLYLRCENTNLASLSVAFENIASLGAPVENVTIYKSHIERLYGTLFFKVKARTLYIDETPIKSIDEHTFHGINRTLQELHIINSQLLEFPGPAFKILGNLSVLNIDGHRIQKIEKDVMVDSLLAQRLDKLHIVNGALDELPVESFQPLRKLKTLDLHGNALTVLKRNQFKNLRDVEVLDISHNNITKLEAQHIADLTKLSWCNVSHNALTELARGTFARNSVLKVLNMAHNKIKRLDANSFRGMRFLRRLYLSDNQISDIGRGTFGSVTRIGTIDLARNALKKIDYQMFFQLNYIEIIDVSQNNITEIEKQSFKDVFLARINISHNQVEKIANYAFENCANITVLDLSHNMIKKIDRDVFDSATYATELQLSYNYLTEMTQVPLHNMTGLKILNVSHNIMESIPKNTFPKLYELHTIDASYNNLTTIASAIFQSLFSLRYMNLSHNQFEDIKSSTFGTLPTLLQLDLSNNRLKSIARGGMAKLTSLRQMTLRNNMLEKLFQIPISLINLDLSNNWLQEIPDTTWPRMNSLLSLDLSGNRLANNLKGGSFSGLLVLQTLKLNANGIMNVPLESLSDLSTLQYIYLENNNITKLSKSAFGKLPSVFEVDLYNNKINNISVRAFDGLLQLLTLNLSGNALKTIPNGAFTGMVSLKKLDLSHNLIEKLDNKTHGVLDDCLSLESVYLNHNKISFVTRKTFPSTPYVPFKLKEIDLSFNSMPVLTYDLTFGTKKVEKLNVSHNYINDIRRGVLSNLTALRVLDISANDITDLTIENDVFRLPGNISEIYMQNNRIVKLPYEEFLKPANLSLIDLRNNQIDQFPVQLTEKVKQKTEVQFEGNPLDCTCEIRPIKHYLQTMTFPPPEFANLECFAPVHVSGKRLTEVPDDQLHCSGSGNFTGPAGEEYDILPDLRFREITYHKSKLSLRWYVTTTADVADFYVNIRDKRNMVYFDQHLSYTSRQVVIEGAHIEKAISQSDFVQVCVLAKNSVGVIGRWFESQCIKIPDNFQSVIRKYDEEYNAVYTIMAAPVKRHSSFLSNGSQRNIFDWLPAVCGLILSLGILILN